ncbi:MAG TPA: cell division protein [Caulobacteraceae bacterium]|nr:cell division protein [Caulobacteraceae bacterium]
MMEELLDRRWRGFRLVELTGLALLLVLMLVLYLAKTGGGAERSEIARVEREISQEKERVRLLRAEVAHLEQPERLERLSRDFLGLGPVAARQEIAADSVASLTTGAGQQQP